MAKYYGKIGFCVTDESAPGVWAEDTIEERNYYGELTRNTRRLQGREYLNDGVNVSNQISILADPYATANFHTMRYAEYMGVKWKVTDVEVQYPRLVLTLGGEYNGGNQT